MYRFFKEEIIDLMSLVQWTQINGIREMHDIRDLKDVENLYVHGNKLLDEECQNVKTGFYFRRVHPKDETRITLDYYFTVEEPVVYI